MKTSRFITLLMGAVVALMAVTSCGGGSEASSPEADAQRSELYKAMDRGDIQLMEQIADSLAFTAVEDLSVDETVAVLIAYLKVHNDAVARNDSQRDLVTLRKFVDVYDIALANHGDRLIEAFSSAEHLNERLSLPSVADDFRARLNEYDSGDGASEAAAAEAAAEAEEPISNIDPEDRPDSLKHVGVEPVAGDSLY